MALQMSQVHGLGQAEIVAAILGPLVTGGADIYRTSEEGKFSKDQLKQRQREFEASAKFQQEQFEAEERARIMGRHAAVQQSAIRSAWLQQNMPLIIGGGLLIALGLAAALGSRRK